MENQSIICRATRLFWMFLVISENDNLGDKTTSDFRARLCVIGKKPLP